MGLDHQLGEPGLICWQSRKMRRPTGRMSLRHATIVGLLMTVGGALYLDLALNPLTGTLALLTAFVYLAAYTPLKKVLAKKLKNPEFRLHFEESRSVSELCLAVATARQAMQLSQQELAKRVGTTQSVIARLENGNQGRMPSLSLLSRIAATSYS